MSFVTSYSACIAEAAMHVPRRGVVHSVFNAAANIVFPCPSLTSSVPVLLVHPGGFVLSLNAASTPRMPNGIQLASSAGSFPFSALRPGMPVLFGAHYLHIEAIDCSLDLSQSPQWNPHIQRPAQLDMAIVQQNYSLLKTISQLWLKEHNQQRNSGDYYPGPEHTTDILTLAHYACGRGLGLTPTGDDILAGWMAAGWLLYGAEPDFIETCQHILQIATRQTHLLSQCWLSYAAEGNVAEPISALLHAITYPGDAQLERALTTVLAMGATSGYDLCQGILLSASIRI